MSKNYNGLSCELRKAIRLIGNRILVRVKIHQDLRHPLFSFTNIFCYNVFCSLTLLFSSSSFPLRILSHFLLISFKLAYEKRDRSKQGARNRTRVV